MAALLRSLLPSRGGRCRAGDGPTDARALLSRPNPRTQPAGLGPCAPALGAADAAVQLLQVCIAEDTREVTAKKKARCTRSKLKTVSAGKSHYGGGGGGGVSPLKRRSGWSSFHGNSGQRKPHLDRGACWPQPSHLQEEDGNVEMVDVQEEHQVRHTPYAVPQRRRAKWPEEARMHTATAAPGWRDRSSVDREMGLNTLSTDMEPWFKVSIPCGKTIDKDWLLSSLQQHSKIPFTAVDFHYVRNRAQFFVQGARVATAVKNASYKIHDDRKNMISLYVCPSDVPLSIRDKLEPGELKQLELTMSKRYNTTLCALDLHRLHFDPDLMNNDINIVLGRRSCMSAVMQIIERNYCELLSLNVRDNRLHKLDGLCEVTQKAPKIKVLNLSHNELKTMWEVSKMKGLKLEELWLEGNPLCADFADHAAYVSEIRDCFPKLLRLDGQDLAIPIVIDAMAPDVIKPCQESYKGPDALKDLVQQFLQEYYSIFDYGDRQGLLAAYHDECCFSLSIPSNPEDSGLSSLCELYKDNRNMKALADPFVRVQLLKHTKQDVVRSLCCLPRTQHDFNNLVVDMSVQTETMLCFSVHGVFKEVEGGPEGAVRAFTRIFIASPGRNSGLCIVNDQLLVRNATLSEAQNAFPGPVPTPTAGSLPVLSQLQQEMVQAFSSQSGMKPDWSMKCLQDNDWNYIKAGQVFLSFKKEGKIPKEAFQ